MHELVFVVSLHGVVHLGDVEVQGYRVHTESKKNVSHGFQEIWSLGPIVVRGGVALPTDGEGRVAHQTDFTCGLVWPDNWMVADETDGKALFLVQGNVVSGHPGDNTSLQLVVYLPLIVF